jgi:hypothetical protein
LYAGPTGSFRRVPPNGKRFYEEQKHALVLMEYLHRFRKSLAPGATPA